MARYAHAPDSALLALIEVVSAVAPDRILLGGDVARRSRFVSYGGLPRVAYLATQFVPRLRKCIGSDLVDTILVDNPRHWLDWRR